MSKEKSVTKIKKDNKKIELTEREIEYLKSVIQQQLLSLQYSFPKKDKAPDPIKKDFTLANLIQTKLHLQ